MAEEALSLTRRESQIMAALYKNGPSTIAEIAAAIPKPPSNTALRTLLKILEHRGHVTSAKDGRKNVYRPKVSRKKAAGSAFRHVLNTFFGGSLSGAITAHLSDPKTKLEPQEVERLSQLIAQSSQGEQEDE